MFGCVGSLPQPMPPTDRMAEKGKWVFCSVERSLPFFAYCVNYFLASRTSMCFNTLMKINSDKIRNELKRIGITHEDFAKSIDMTRQGFGLMLKTKTTTFKTINTIAEKLSLDAKDLII